MNDTVVLGGEVELIKRIDGTASLSTTINGQAISYLGGGGRLQEKEVTPGEEDMVITPDDGFTGISAITVRAVPNNYGLITWNGSFLTVS